MVAKTYLRPIFLFMKNSLKKTKEFKKVYDNKKSYSTKNLVLFILKNDDMERNRLGISVSHKVGNSVIRHTLTRRAREIYRKNEQNLKKTYDIVLVFRVNSDKAEFFKLNNDFIYLCKKLGIWDENNEANK